MRAVEDASLTHPLTRAVLTRLRNRRTLFGVWLIERLLASHLNKELRE
jgi:hypothetical protein